MNYLFKKRKKFPIVLESFYLKNNFIRSVKDKIKSIFNLKTKSSISVKSFMQLIMRLFLKTSTKRDKHWTEIASFQTLINEKINKKIKPDDYNFSQLQKELIYYITNT